MTKLYVGNLPYSFRGEDLSAVFEKYGPVASAIIITDKATRRSKGFGFVELEDDSGAQKALEEMNSKEIEGRTLKVSVARPREER